MPKTKVELEFALQSVAPKLLWQFIATPYGLEKWFADEVKQTDAHNYTFAWGGSEQQATLTSMQRKLFTTRFSWLDQPMTYFEMRIVRGELVRSTVLLITDFADSPDDALELRQLWSQQVGRLRTELGCAN